MTRVVLRLAGGPTPATPAGVADRMKQLDALLATIDTVRAGVAQSPWPGVVGGPNGITQQTAATSPFVGGGGRVRGYTPSALAWSPATTSASPLVAPFGTYGVRPAQTTPQPRQRAAVHVRRTGSVIVHHDE